MTKWWDNIFKSSNSMLDSVQPEVVTEYVPAPGTYNRHERRTGSFVIHNLTSDKYVRSFRRQDGTLVFKDVDLNEASIYMFSSLDYVMSHILLFEPNLNIEYKMVYKQGKELKTK